MPDIHIIPSGDRWNVKQENGDIVSAHDTQAEAEKAGKDWARVRTEAAKSSRTATKASSPASAKATRSKRPPARRAWPQRRPPSRCVRAAALITRALSVNRHKAFDLGRRSTKCVSWLSSEGRSELSQIRSRRARRCRKRRQPDQTVRGHAVPAALAGPARRPPAGAVPQRAGTARNLPAQTSRPRRPRETGGPRGADRARRIARKAEGLGAIAGRSAKGLVAVAASTAKGLGTVATRTKGLRAVGTAGLAGRRFGRRHRVGPLEQFVFANTGVRPPSGGDVDEECHERPLSWSRSAPNTASTDAGRSP